MAAKDEEVHSGTRLLTHGELVPGLIQLVRGTFM